MNYYEELRKLFKQKREELNMKQTEVAEQADISNNFYSNIERGTTKPSVETVLKICTVLQLSLDKIIFCEKMTSEELQSKEVNKEIENMIKSCNNKNIEDMILFCNSMITILNKMKEN